MKQFLLVEGFLSAATYLSGSFILIFFLRRGFYYTDCSLFYVICYISAVVALLLITGRTIRRPRIWMAAGMLVLALSYGSYLVLPPSWALILAPIPFGAYIPLYWLPFNTLYMELTKATDRGVASGVMFLIFPLIGIMFPLIGGATIEVLDYSAIFLFAVILLMANALLIAALPAFTPQPVRNQIIFDQMGKGVSTGFLLEGVQEGVLWITVPLLSFGFAQGELGLGTLLALFALGGALATIFVGRVTDVKGRRGLFAKIGALATGPLIMLSAAMQDVMSYTLVMGVMNFFLPIMWIMLLALSIDLAEKHKGGAVFTREVLLNVGRLIGCCITFAVLFFTVTWLSGGSALRIAHALAGVSVLLIGLFRLKRPTSSK